MDKCSDCGRRCGENRIVLECAGRREIFCSFECLITHSAAIVRNRIARQSRRVQRYAQARMRCERIRASRAARVRLPR